MFPQMLHVLVSWCNFSSLRVNGNIFFFSNLITLIHFSWYKLCILSILSKAYIIGIEYPQRTCYLWIRIDSNMGFWYYFYVRDSCDFIGKYRGPAHSICNGRSGLPNEFLVVFHNVSNYDYQFIIKEFSNDFEGQIEYIGKKRKSIEPFLFQ